MQRFTELKVWQRSHTLVLRLYPIAGSLPVEERYGLISQLRRAATAVPTNIAEGSKRQTKPDFAHFLNIAEGSLAETEYLVMLARDLNYLVDDVTAPILSEINEIARMLYVFRTTIQREHSGLSSVD
jgi:four helix bundle protein